MDCVARDSEWKQFDVEISFGYGLPIYHIDKQIKEVGESFPDEAHIIYVNSKKQEDTELGRLMHDLHCRNADEILICIVLSCEEVNSLL